MTRKKKANNWDHQPDKVKQVQTEQHTGGCLWKMLCHFQRLFTSSEMSSLLGKFWLTAAREACSMSRMHLLMLSIDESHSRWPGALSLGGKMEEKKRRAIKLRTEIRNKMEEDILGGKTGTQGPWRWGKERLFKTRGEKRGADVNITNTGSLISLLISSHLLQCGLKGLVAAQGDQAGQPNELWNLQMVWSTGHTGRIILWNIYFHSWQHTEH